MQLIEVDEVKHVIQGDFGLGLELSLNLIKFRVFMCFGCNDVDLMSKMPLTSSHSQIENQIETFVENFRKSGSTLFPPMEGAVNQRPRIPHSTSRTSQLSPSDDSAATDSCSCPLSMPSVMDSSSCDDVIQVEGYVCGSKFYDLHYVHI
uniref:Uncharacterized protein n=1 Tax=Strigamia maritima TaxID=126957 RepID=T1JI66_STRMM